MNADEDDAGDFVSMCAELRLNSRERMFCRGREQGVVATACSGRQSKRSVRGRVEMRRGQRVGRYVYEREE